MKSMRYLCVVLSCLLLVGIMCSCSSKISSEDNNIEIVLQDGWSVDKDIDQTADIAVSDRKENRYMTFYSISDEEVGEIDIDAFAKQVYEDVSEKAGKTGTTIKMGELSEFDILTFDVNGKDVFYRVYCIENDYEFIEVVCWSAPDDKQSACEQFGAILNTIVLK